MVHVPLFFTSPLLPMACWNAIPIHSAASAPVCQFVIRLFFCLLPPASEVRPCVLTKPSALSEGKSSFSYLIATWKPLQAETHYVTYGRGDHVRRLAALGLRRIRAPDQAIITTQRTTKFCCTSELLPSSVLSKDNEVVEVS